MNELRTSGLIQASICALVVGYVFRHSTPVGPHPIWPYVVIGYAVLASLMPWATGCFVEGEFSLPYSLVLGVIYALPMGLAGHWLRHSAYPILGVLCWILAGCWGVHGLLSVAALVRRSVG